MEDYEEKGKKKSLARYPKIFFTSMHIYIKEAMRAVYFKMKAKGLLRISILIWNLVGYYFFGQNNIKLLSNTKTECELPV